jgi:hypothetical protein
MLIIGNTIFSQKMCFWVSNNSDDTFSSLRIRGKVVTNFGDDLLAYDMIDPGDHFWVKTHSINSSLYDLEIARLNGDPLRFKWEAKNGKVYNRSSHHFRYFPLNTLMITTEDKGNIAWDISNYDKYGSGDPCNS